MLNEQSLLCRGEESLAPVEHVYTTLELAPEGRHLSNDLTGQRPAMHALDAFKKCCACAPELRREPGKRTKLSKNRRMEDHQTVQESDGPNNLRARSYRPEMRTERKEGGYIHDIFIFCIDNIIGGAVSAENDC